MRVALMTYAIDGRKAKGTAIVARKMTEFLLSRQDEYDITLVHFERSDDSIYARGAREVLIPELPIRLLNKRFLRTLYYFLTTTDSYDIIQWFQPRVYPFFWLAPALKKVVWIHGAGDLGAENVTGVDLGRSLFNFSLRFWSGKVSMAIAGSEFARKDIISKYRFTDSSRVAVIHNGVSDIFYPRTQTEVDAVRKKYTLPDRFIMNVARLNPGKNAFRVIKAFDRYASSSSDTSVHFVNIGSRGSEEHAVKGFVSKSLHKDRIHFVEYVDERDLPAFYSASLGLVFPLLNEGFGLPNLEAMACGIPVVVSNTCRPELDEDTAVLVDALSVESIAAGIGKIVGDDVLRKKLISNGQTKAAVFSWENTGLSLTALYRELLGR